jgi:hypothetical protein
MAKPVVDLNDSDANAEPLETYCTFLKVPPGLGDELSQAHGLPCQTLIHLCFPPASQTQLPLNMSTNFRIERHMHGPEKRREASETQSSNSGHEGYGGYPH